jgi:hypothetical protein
MNKDYLLREIDKLPEDLLPEVFDFIKFLENRQNRENISLASQILSEKAFKKIWDNEEDACYDNL